jgi:hypothetical protein
MKTINSVFYNAYKPVTGFKVERGVHTI